MVTKLNRSHPMWDALKRRDALEQAERRDRRVSRRQREKRPHLDPSLRERAK